MNRRMAVEIVGLKNVSSRIAVFFDVDPAIGLMFDDIKDELSKITADQCMLIDEKTMVAATYDANTKTFS